MSVKVTADFGGKEIIVETGRLAKQASGSVTVQVGGTVVLVAVVASKKPREGIDFLPLMVDYRDKFYAAGKIPGGFFKREGRPGDSETLKARLIDRPLRPLFPDGYRNDTQVYVTVLSVDKENPSDILALIGASCALCISDIPFYDAIAAVRIGNIDGDIVVNPTYQQLEESKLDLVVAGTRNAVTMVESGANEVSESEMIVALREAHSEIVKIIDMVEELTEKCGVGEATIEEPEENQELVTEVKELFMPFFDELYQTHDKGERMTRHDEIEVEIQEKLAEKYPEQEECIAKAIEKAFKNGVRGKVIDDGIRPDGRGLEDIREITCEVSVLPRTHGSAVFTRGQTQSLAVVTLGSPDDKQMIDNLLGQSYKRFMFHYNFPSYSVGETRPPRGPGRREIGHGALAERAIFPLLPETDLFPYTIRVVSEILESNGSSSMAAVCSGTLSLMDAGVPLDFPVAGIAMGLMIEGDKYAILTDIQGLEDHYGDMDFKVTGTANGITALQMDIKIEGVTFEIMEEALQKAKVARAHVLEKMLECLPTSREKLSPYAPHLETITIPVDKIGLVIGPGGKMIKSITEETGAKISIEDDGTVFISSEDDKGCEAAVQRVKDITADVEVNQTYTGKVVKTTNFGAFVQILPGKDGLVHISELDLGRVNEVEDICKVGDSFEVKVIGIDDMGRIKLSRKVLLPGYDPSMDRRDDRGGRGGRDSRDRSDRPRRPRRE